MNTGKNRNIRLSVLWRFFILPAYRPVKGIYELTGNPQKLVDSTIIFLFLGIIYTISVQIAYSKGLGAKVEPFIKISAEDYYYWQRFYQIPFFFITSIIFAGIVRLLSSLVNGTGKFEDLYSLFCVAQTFPMFITMWLPETILIIFFPDRSIQPAWLDAGRQIAGILWPLLIMTVGISKIEKIKLLYSIIIMIISAIPITVLMLIFIR